MYFTTKRKILLVTKTINLVALAMVVSTIAEGSCVRYWSRNENELFNPLNYYPCTPVSTDAKWTSLHIFLWPHMSRSRDTPKSAEKRAKKQADCVELYSEPNATIAPKNIDKIQRCKSDIEEDFFKRTGLGFKLWPQWLSFFLSLTILLISISLFFIALLETDDDGYAKFSCFNVIVSTICCLAMLSVGGIQIWAALCKYRPGFYAREQTNWDTATFNEMETEFQDSRKRLGCFVKGWVTSAGISFMSGFLFLLETVLIFVGGHNTVDPGPVVHFMPSRLGSEQKVEEWDMTSVQD